MITSCTFVGTTTLSAGLCGVLFSARTRNLSPLQNVQTSAEPRQPPTARARGFSPRGQSGRGVKITTYLLSIFVGMCVLTLVQSNVVCMWVNVQNVVSLLFILCLLLFVMFSLLVQCFLLFTLFLFSYLVCSVFLHCYVYCSSCIVVQCIVVSFLFVFSFMDQCHRVETEMQLINIVSYIQGSGRVTLCPHSTCKPSRRAQ